MYLTKRQVNIVAAAMTSHRKQLAQRMTREIINGHDRNVRRLLTEVNDVDELTAAFATADQPTVRLSDFAPQTITLKLSTLG